MADTLSYAKFTAPENRAQAQQAMDLYRRGKAWVAGQDPALRPFINTIIQAEASIRAKLAQDIKQTVEPVASQAGFFDQYQGKATTFNFAQYASEKGAPTAGVERWRSFGLGRSEAIELARMEQEQQRTIDPRAVITTPQRTVEAVPPTPGFFEDPFSSSEAFIREQRQIATTRIARDRSNFLAQATLFGAGFASSVVGTGRFVQKVTTNPLGPIVAVGEEVGKGVYEGGRRIVTGEGFPEVGRVLREEPAFAAGFVASEAVQAIVGGKIVSKMGQADVAGRYASVKRRTGVKPKVSHGVSAQDTRYMGKDAVGNKLWRVETEIETILSHPKTGKVLDKIKTSAITEVVTSETASGAIKAVTDTYGRVLKKGGIRKYVEEGKVTFKEDIVRAKGDTTFEAGPKEDIFIGRGDTDIVDFGVMRMRQFPERLEIRTRKKLAQAESRALSETIVEIGKPRPALRQVKEGVFVEGKEVPSKFVSRTDTTPERYVVSGYKRSTYGGPHSAYKVTETIRPYTRKFPKGQRPVRDYTLGQTKTFEPLPIEDVKTGGGKVSKKDSPSLLQDQEVLFAKEQTFAQVAAATDASKIGFSKSPKKVPVKSTGPKGTQVQRPQIGMGSSLTATGLVSKSAQGLRQQATRESVKEKSPTRIKPRSESVMLDSLISKTNISPTTDTATNIKQRHLQQPILGVSTKQKVKPQETLTAAQRSTFIPFVPTIPKTRRIKPPPAEIPKKYRLDLPGERPRYVEGVPYDAYVKVAGTSKGKMRWQKVNKEPLTKESALSAATRAVDETISATGKVVRAMQKAVNKGNKQPRQKVLDTRDPYYKINKRKFRGWKTKKKQPLPQGTFIERQKYRLDNPREVGALGRGPFI